MASSELEEQVRVWPALAAGTLGAGAEQKQEQREHERLDVVRHYI